MILVAAMSLLTSAGVVWGGSTAGAASSTITIGGIGDLTGQASSPQPTQGLQAYAAFVNSHGGISGHHLKVISCDGAEDPNKYAACAHELSGNSAVVASTDLGGSEFGQSDPILAAGGVGIVDSDPVSATEFDAPNSVSATGGVPTSFGAIVKYFATVKHIKSIAFVSLNGIGTQLQAIVESFAKPYNITVEPYLFPETTTDFTATATAVAASNASVILGSTGVQSVGPLLLALKAAGNSIPVSFFDTSVTPAAIKEAGSASNGLYTTDAFPTLATATGQDKTAMENYIKGMAAAGQKTGSGSLQGWASGLMLTTIIEKLGVANATRAAILKVIESGTIDNAPLYPKAMGKKISAPPIASFSSLINPNDFMGQYENGTYKILPGVGRINPYKA
jgi:ABC-type branched-subunit amino acid transport system substrate-binding protein